MSYVPGKLDQRPPTEMADPILHELLNEAVTMGYATGSVGASFSREDQFFRYEVKYEITRIPSPAEKLSG